jgi:hypothetical protein
LLDCEPQRTPACSSRLALIALSVQLGSQEYKNSTNLRLPTI